MGQSATSAVNQFAKLDFVSQSRQRLAVRVAANRLVKITMQRGTSGPFLLSEIMIAKNIICGGVQNYHSDKEDQVGARWTGQQHSEKRLFCS
jgi:hypothetical protein